MTEQYVKIVKHSLTQLQFGHQIFWARLRKSGAIWPQIGPYQNAYQIFFQRHEKLLSGRNSSNLEKNHRYVCFIFPRNASLCPLPFSILVTFYISLCFPLETSQARHPKQNLFFLLFAIWLPRWFNVGPLPRGGLTDMIFISAFGTYLTRR